ncbi:hypothetical protein ACIBKX_33610 [Streptomyces sp. NPDC050658]|uniref:hypothetical protein n=1 Tax=unclassified Streptomyces TaxID=2593676 RepID=UPI00342E0DBF
MTSYWYCDIEFTNNTSQTLVLEGDDIYSTSDYSTNPETGWDEAPKPRIHPGERVTFGQKSGDINWGIGGTKSYRFWGYATYTVGLSEDRVKVDWDFPKDNDSDLPVQLTAPNGYTLKPTSWDGDRFHKTVRVELSEPIEDIPLRTF